MERRTINPWRWQDEYGFSQAQEIVAPQRILYCAGQTAMDAEGAPQHAGDMSSQLGLALDNLEAVLSAAGYSLSDVVRLNYYATDLDELFAHYGVVVERLAAAGCQPSGSMLQVSRLAFPELLIEIEATAAR